MKWYQAHLRVMSRMFELGFFDEVNASYRNYCLENTPSAYQQLLSLVINDDIKLYCDALSAKKLAKNTLTTSNIVAYFFKATAGFTMFKALKRVFVSDFDDICASDEMPSRCYNALFEPNGELKDDALMQAVKAQTFKSSPTKFVSALLKFDIISYITSNAFNLPLLSEDEPFFFGFGGSNVQTTISRSEVEALIKAESKQKTPRVLAQETSTAKEFNYFHIDSKLDSGFGLLRVFDLLGMHLLLVAQRRKYLFECYRKDDLRSNYKSLEQVKSDDIVRLHNKAVVACGVFEEAQKGLINIHGAFNDFNAIVKAYVGRNDALYQYLCYFCDLFDDLAANTSSTNEESSWAVSFYYYNFYEPFKQFSQLQARLLKNVNDLLAIDVSLLKGRTELVSFDQEIMSNIIDLLQTSMYDLCARFAPSFKSAQLSHPRVVNFQDIVNSCLTYGKSLNRATPTLPYPIKVDSPYNQDDDGDPSKLNSDENNITHIHEKLAYEVINDPKPIEFSRKLNVYLDMFSFMSIMVELYNSLYFKTMFVLASELNSNRNLRFAFDLSNCGIDWEKAVYPSYEKLLKDETFAQLLETHKACFDKLVLILDLQGDSHLLYEDGYTANLLRKTNNYDQEFAHSLVSGHATSYKPNLSKAEQILLNKTCIGYLQECHKLCQISKVLANKNTEFDNFLNEKNGKFIALKTQFFSTIYNMYLLPLRALSQYLMLNLDNVPEELKSSVGFKSDHELSNKVSNLRSLFDISSNEAAQSFYKCVYETILTMMAKDLNSHLKLIIPYSYLETKQDFAKSLQGLILMMDEHCVYNNTNYIIMVAAKRLLQSYDYDQSVQKQISQNTLFVNSALGLILTPFSGCVQYIMIALVKDFVHQVLAFTRIKQVDEHEEYLNTVYNMVHKLFNFCSTNTAKIESLNSLSEQNNAMLSEQFEYKEYILEIIDVLSMSHSLWSKYMLNNSGLKAFNRAINIASWISLYQDLLENAPKVLQCIDVSYFKNLGTSLGTVIPFLDDQEYISLKEDYGQNVIESAGERLTIHQLSVVKHIFGEGVCSWVEEEDNNYYGGDDDVDDFFLFSRFFRRVPREKGLTKTNLRLIDLVKEKMHLLDDDQLHQLLNLESHTMATQIVDSSTSSSIAKAKAKAKATTAKSKIATVKSKATAATKSKAQKAATKDAADANVIIEPLDSIEAEAKPKAKTTRSKAKKAEATSESKAGSKPKSKSTTKATATKSKAKKVATTSSNEATATADSAEATEDKPKKKATRAKKASTAIATATAKATAGKYASAQARAELELEANAKPKAKGDAKSTTKATATKSRAKKVAEVDSTEAKANDDAEAKPKKKASTARTTSKASASTRTKKSTAKS